MADILKNSIASQWDIKQPPEVIGWQHPIIARKSQKSPDIRMDDFMLDALVRPSRDELHRRFSTPLFTRKNKHYKLLDDFTKKKQKKGKKGKKGMKGKKSNSNNKAIFPDKKLVEGDRGSVNFNSSSFNS